MTKHFAPRRSSKRGKAVRPHLRNVIMRYAHVRAHYSRVNLPMPGEYYLGLKTGTLRSLLQASDDLERIREYLSIVLTDEAHQDNTAWLERPQNEVVTALSGLLVIQEILRIPFNAILDDQVPLDVRLTPDVSLEDALMDIIATSRAWSATFDRVFATPAFRLAPVMKQFEQEVVRIAAQVQTASSAMARYVPTMNQQAEVVACM